MVTEPPQFPSKELVLAKVLLVGDEVAPRLTLQAILRASGYAVDVACSADEALGKMDEHQYELILSDFREESPEVGLEVLAHARLMDYQPATAILTTDQAKDSGDWLYPILIEPQDIPELLSKVADLISQRAARLVKSQLK
ncbi:MAG: response regulator [Acidobacteriaceae bacterium]|nr:response regulator [Acidobacteriaceae bacterium]